MNLVATSPEQRTITFTMDNLRVEPSKSGDGSIHVTGYAAVFNSLSEDLGGFREKIAPGAFEQTLQDNPDVCLVVGHDLNRVLARTTSGTLEVREDGIGLKVWAKLDPADLDVQAIVPKMKRGDVNKMSFAFTIGADDWEQVEDQLIRTIESVANMWEVSIVSHPAYTATDVNLRSSVLEPAIASGRVPMEQPEEGSAVEEPAASQDAVAQEEALDASTETNAAEGSVSQFERMKAIAAAEARMRLHQIQLTD